MLYLEFGPIFKYNSSSSWTSQKMRKMRIFSGSGLFMRSYKCPGKINILIKKKSVISYLKISCTSMNSEGKNIRKFEVHNNEQFVLPYFR